MNYVTQVVETIRVPNVNEVEKLSTEDIVESKEVESETNEFKQPEVTTEEVTEPAPVFAGADTQGDNLISQAVNGGDVVEEDNPDTVNEPVLV